jgi:hypothetical protein
LTFKRGSITALGVSLCTNVTGIKTMADSLDFLKVSQKEDEKI